MQEVDPFSDVKDGKQHAAQALGKLMAAQPGRFPPVLAQINAAAQPILQQYFQQPAENRSISSREQAKTVRVFNKVIATSTPMNTPNCRITGSVERHREKKDVQVVSVVTSMAPAAFW